MLFRSDKKVAAKAINDLYNDIRSLPYWVDSNGNAEFDLEPLGPNATSEKGARMYIIEILEMHKARYE